MLFLDNSLIIEFLNNENIVYREEEPMASHTTFKIGGPADIFVQPASETKLAKLIAFCNVNEYPVHILGNGSNLLVSDMGVEGVVIHIGALTDFTVGGTNEIVCGSGLRLSLLCSYALESGLTGLEFAWGIPGLVGGAVYMNAGAYGGEMSQVVLSAKAVD